MDIGMNTEFKVKSIRKDDRYFYSRNLPKLILLKKDLFANWALMHNYGIITVLAFSQYANPFLAQIKPNGKLRFLVDIRKSNNLIADDYVSNNHAVSALSDAAHIWQVNLSSASSISPRLITVSTWRIKRPWKRMHFFPSRNFA